MPLYIRLMSNSSINIVREMTDHEAVQAMKDSNKQRDGMLPSELAALLELEVEDIKHQGGRLKGVAEGDVGKRSVEIVGEVHEMNYKKVMRYLRLNSLVPELLDKVDDKKMGFMRSIKPGRTNTCCFSRLDRQTQ